MISSPATCHQSLTSHRYSDYRVLVIEDHDVTAFGFQSMLAEIPEVGACFSAGSISKALKLSQQESFDLCLLGMYLPDGRGLDIIPRLRARHPDIKFIVTSGEFDSELSKALKTKGVELINSKSCTQAEFTHLFYQTLNIEEPIPVL